MNQSQGRGEGLKDFAQKLRSIYESEPEEWSVLDVGGGDGWFAAFFPVRTYWCLDPYYVKEFPLLPYGRHHIKGTAESMPFGDGLFDLVISKQTLVHFHDPEKACREMLRVAKHHVVIRQEFPEEPIGWPGHSRVTIDSPHDILAILRQPGWTVRYDGVDFIARREE